jgi:hypothetical protein
MHFRHFLFIAISLGPFPANPQTPSKISPVRPLLSEQPLIPRDQGALTLLDQVLSKLDNDARRASLRESAHSASITLPAHRDPTGTASWNTTEETETFQSRGDKGMAYFSRGRDHTNIKLEVAGNAVNISPIEAESYFDPFDIGLFLMKSKQDKAMGFIYEGRETRGVKNFERIQLTYFLHKKRIRKTLVVDSESHVPVALEFCLAGTGSPATCHPMKYIYHEFRDYKGIFTPSSIDLTDFSGVLSTYTLLAEPAQK